MNNVINWTYDWTTGEESETCMESPTGFPEGYGGFVTLRGKVEKGRGFGPDGETINYVSIISVEQANTYGTPAWNDVKEYVLASAQMTRDIGIEIPRPKSMSEVQK